MPVATFYFTPPAREDEKAWTGALIETSASSTGPWGSIDIYDLDPVATDPSDPPEYGFTVSTPDPWIRLTWLDEDGNASLPTQPLQNRSAYVAVDEIKPSLAEVAALIPGRVTENGEGAITFNADTNPTGTQAQTVIDTQAGEIYDRCEAIRVDQIPFAKSVVALASALVIERGFFPQEQDNAASILDDLRADYNVKVVRLEQATRLPYVSKLP